LVEVGLENGSTTTLGGMVKDIMARIGNFEFLIDVIVLKVGDYEQCRKILERSFL